MKQTTTTDTIKEFREKILVELKREHVINDTKWMVGSRGWPSTVLSDLESKLETITTQILLNDLLEKWTETIKEHDEAVKSVDKNKGITDPNLLKAIKLELKLAAYEDVCNSLKEKQIKV